MYVRLSVRGRFLRHNSGGGCFRGRARLIAAGLQCSCDCLCFVWVCLQSICSFRATDRQIQAQRFILFPPQRSGERISASEYEINIMLSGVSDQCKRY